MHGIYNIKIHCRKLKVSNWSAQFQRDANVAGAHQPSILCLEVKKARVLC